MIRGLLLFGISYTIQDLTVHADASKSVFAAFAQFTIFIYTCLQILKLINNKKNETK